MPFTQKLLLMIPTVPMGILIVILALALTCSGLLLVRKLVPKHVLKSHYELANAVFNAIALAYTVLLAFVVVVAWQNFNETKTDVETEANCVVDLYRDSAAFPPVFQGQVQGILKHYVNTVVGEEWPMLARGQESETARAALRKAWSLYTAFEPKTEKEKIFLAEAAGKLNELREARRLRIIDSRAGIHGALWFILIVGGFTTISFTFFFGADSFATHLAMASSLAIVIALILYTILLFDFPFTGDVRIGPEIFQQIINF